MQKRFQEEPEYKVLKEISQNNNSDGHRSFLQRTYCSFSAADMQFVVGVFMSGGNLLGLGQARSKAAAR